MAFVLAELKGVSPRGPRGRESGDRVATAGRGSPKRGRQNLRLFIFFDHAPESNTKLTAYFRGIDIRRRGSP
jgi:hypothetical protein